MPALFKRKAGNYETSIQHYGREFPQLVNLRIYTLNLNRFGRAGYFFTFAAAHN